MRERRLPTLLVLGMMLAALMGSVLGQSEPRYGGRLNVGMEADPPALDMHFSNHNLVRFVADHMYEQLFTLDSDFRPIPVLAEGYAISDDGTVYTFTIRQGVRFHNGQELTSADVVASLDRWLAMSSSATPVRDNVVSVEATDEYTVVMTLERSMGYLLSALTTRRAGAVIYPREVVEATPEGEPIVSFIGTGPFELVEWREGNYVLLQRYEDYSPVELEPSGYGGRNTAYLDEIRFNVVPDASVRLLGLEAGDFHYADPLSNDDYARIEENPDLLPVLFPWMMNVSLNLEGGLTADLDIRRAILAATDGEELLFGVHGDPFFWRLDPAFMWQETAWWSDAGAELYNQADPERARQILEEAGYDGTPLHLVVSATQRPHYDASLILRQQLEQAGFNVRVEEFDLATHRQIINDPARWEVTTRQSSYRDHPLMHLHIDGNYSGWWRHDEKDALIEQLFDEPDPDAALAIWERIQELHYEDIPMIKVGDFFRFGAVSANLHGFDTSIPEPFFWNAWLAE